MDRTKSRRGELSAADKRIQRSRAAEKRSEDELKVAREFKIESTVYNESIPELSYRRRKGEVKNTVKWGQRKLALSTIQFFTLYWNPKEIPKPVCVYVGAAPGYTINVMKILFPDIEWHLYDSAHFNRKLPKENVTIYNRYFENEDIKTWTDKNIFFISDIRDPEYQMCFSEDLIVKPSVDANGTRRKLNKYDCDKVVLRDMLLQQKWVYEINPKAAHLKFRPPWAGDRYKDGKAIFPYLQGHAYFQPWLGPSSTETRLVPVRNESGNYYSVNWDAQKFEDKLFYHNSMARNVYKYINPYTGDNSHIDGMELTDDWDSLFEATILSQYLEKVGSANTLENVQKLSRLLTNTLNDVCPEGSVARSLKDLRLGTNGEEDITEPIIKVSSGTIKIPIKK